jgi:hypothetical protein
MSKQSESNDRVPTRRYRSFEEFRDRFYRGTDAARKQAVEQQTASFGKRLAKQIIRGASAS